jgi:membrane-associated PAP2 superfamily phosphatase
VTRITRIRVVLAMALAIPASSPGQTADPTSASPQAAADRPVSWKLLLPNILSDQKRIWTFPAGLVRGQNPVPAGAVLGTAAGLVAFDPETAAYFHGTSAFQGFNSVFTSQATSLAMVAAPVSLYVAGLIHKDSKMQRTALLAGEAVGDSEIVTTFLKDATRRIRPAAISMKGNYSDTWFESGGSLFRGSGSFPSGHTIAAFAIATVISRRYGRQHRWVPYAAYGLAVLVAASRISLSAHFLSDAFMGGALGYSISRFAVLRQ